MDVNDTSKEHFEGNKAQTGFPALVLDVVHVWSVGLVDKNVEESLSCLHDDERERALKLGLPADRASFVIVRATLKLLLANYLNIPACDIRIEYGAKGKPQLNIHFSISHSKDQAVIAVSSGEMSALIWSGRIHQSM